MVIFPVYVRKIEIAGNYDIMFILFPNLDRDRSSSSI